MSLSVGIDLGPAARSDTLIHREARDPDRLVLRSRRGGCLGLVGLVLVAAAAFAQARWLAGTAGGWAWALGGLGGALGALLLFGRGFQVLDRKRRRVDFGLEVWVPAILRRRPLAAYTEVVLEEKIDSHTDSEGSTTTTTTFPVTLQGAGVESLEIAQAGVWERAIAPAEEVSRFLGLPFHDRAAEQIQVPSDLDVPLRDQSRARGTTAGKPPRGRRATMEEDEARLQIEIPRPDPRPWLVLAALVAVLWCVPVGLLSRSWWPTLLPLAVVVGTGIKCAFGFRSRIEATPERLRVETWGLVLGRRVDFPTDELEDLIYRDFEWGGPRSSLASMLDGVLVARSDRASIRFGHGLTRAELQWLQRRIVEVIAAPRGRASAPAMAAREAPRRPQWWPAGAGLLAGAVAGSWLGEPLTRCVNLPFLEHLLNLGGVLGLGLGLAWVARRHPSTRPRVMAAAVLATTVMLLAAALGELQPGPGHLERSLARMQPPGPRFWLGWIPLAALLNSAAVGLALKAWGVAWSRTRSSG